MGNRILILTLVLAIGSVVPSGAQSKADFTQFVVMGEGLAAGFADFQLREVYQTNSFPALMAQQINVLFPQPLIQSPGIGYVPGFPMLPVRVPNTLQTTVRLPPGQGCPTTTQYFTIPCTTVPVPVRPDGEGQPSQNIFIFNTSVPNMTVSDALNRTPVPPMVQQADLQQTTINMILGFPGMVTGLNRPVWTQLQYVQELKPTFVLVALGYSEVVAAAAAGDPTLIPSVANFHTNYAAILAGLKSTFAPVLIVNIPDPTDTAYFSTLTSASNLLLASPATIQSLYKLNADDQITINGLVAMANQMNINKVGALPPGSIVSAATIAAIKAGVTALNTEIASQAQSNGSPLYDVRSLFSQLRASGTLANGQTLTADFQGGLYSMCGFYPGSTVQGLIANGILTQVNKTYGSNYALVNLDNLASVDPTVRVTASRVNPRPKPEVTR
jgi:hypothetical protein